MKKIIQRVEPPPDHCAIVDVYFDGPHPRPFRFELGAIPFDFSINDQPTCLWRVVDASGRKVADGYGLVLKLAEIKELMMDICEAGAA